MKLRTSPVISLQNIITRNNGVRIKGELIKALTTDHAVPFLETNEDLALAGKVSKASIDFLTRQIKAIEANIEGKVALREPYAQLVTIHGVGKILGLTIMLETGPISRFDKAGKKTLTRKLHFLFTGIIFSLDGYPLNGCIEI